MREIKFRFWSPKTKCIYADTGLSSLGVNNAIEKANEVGYIFMQYTGLKDKNGKEIYEGDIVRYTYISGFNAEEDYREGADNLGNETQCVGSVEFENGEFTPRPDGSYPADGFYAWRTWDFEVIGNIYENPELLRESR